jgi:hypothetical protein
MPGASQGVFTIYDRAYPTRAPDVSTPALLVAVRLENQIRNDSRETGAFIAADGSIVIQKTGTPDRVMFHGTELAGTRGTLFTHNHPLDRTFSQQDVDAAIRSSLAELRAVGPTVRHRMRAPNGWPTGVDLVNALATAAQTAQKRTAHAIASGALHAQYAQPEVEHQCWVQVSSALGLVYMREKS